MENLFVPYEIALQAKVKGFNEPCIAHYRGNDIEPTCQMGYKFASKTNSDFNDDTSYWLTLPLYQQVIGWLREKHNIDVQYYSDRFSYTIQVIYDTEGNNVCKYIIHNITKSELKSEITKAIGEALKLI